MFKQFHPTKIPDRGGVPGRWFPLTCNYISPLLTFSCCLRNCYCWICFIINLPAGKNNRIVFPFLKASNLFHCFMFFFLVWVYFYTVSGWRVIFFHNGYQWLNLEDHDLREVTTLSLLTTDYAVNVRLFFRSKTTSSGKLSELLLRPDKLWLYQVTGHNKPIFGWTEIGKRIIGEIRCGGVM